MKNLLNWNHKRLGITHASIGIHRAILCVTLSLGWMGTSQAATIIATLNSQDQIVGARMTNGKALGYYVDDTSVLSGGTGTAGSSTRVVSNQIFGFLLPTLTLGQTIEQVQFSVFVSATNDTQRTSTSLHGLTATNPDGSGTSLFSNSSSGALVTAFTSSNPTSVGTTPTAAVTTFIQSLYTGLTPNQTEVFFRLNQNNLLLPSGSAQGDFSRVNFTSGSATLTFTVIPEPSTYALLALGVGAIWLARRIRS